LLNLKYYRLLTISFYHRDRFKFNGCKWIVNPIEKIVELYDEKVSLLERLLKSEQEKVEMLKQNKS
jgi:predicted metallo-beta-lactamase superfamily hydrolase